MAPTRRLLLRGLFQGSAAVVALPFLDCFLDSKGEALAATGRAIPWETAKIMGVVMD